MVKKKKKILPPQLPPEIPDEEIEVSDEDLAFVNEHEKYAGFLAKLDTDLINRLVTRVADHEGELEALYEKRRRKAALKKAKEEHGLQVDRVDALPIKTFDAKLVYRTGNFYKCWKPSCFRTETIDIPSSGGSSVKLHFSWMIPMWNYYFQHMRLQEPNIIFQWLRVV